MPNLTQAREAAGFSYRKAAANLNISISTLWRYESGNVQRPDANLIARMEQLYGVPSGHLMPQAVERDPAA